MQKIVILTFCSLMFLCMSTQAQRFAYVDTDFILENLPEYQKAQEELDKIAKKWQEEIKQKMKEIDKLYNNLEAEEILLTEKQRAERLADIDKREQELKDLQHQRFGPGGDLFKKREELIKPIQDRIFDEIQKLAKSKGLDFIFDKSSGVSMLYANEKHDKSKDILRALGQ